jgi:hypothetical protein
LEIATSSMRLLKSNLTRFKLLTFALCSLLLIGACGDSDPSGSIDDDHTGSGGRGGRDVVDLGPLKDAAVGQDGGGMGGSGNAPSGTGGSSSPTDADTPNPDGGDPLSADADVPVEEAPAPVVNADPAVRGPWPVGARSVRLPLGTGSAMAEIWYPAKLGSEVAKDKHVYDYIAWLPPEAQEDVPAADRPVPVICDCYRDLPIATSHGPFPAVVFAHNLGTAGVSSIGIVAHWASRGFIVLALDHPKIHLQDVLAYASIGWCTASGVTEDVDRTRDVPAELAMLRAPSGDFAFLEGAVDATRIAVVGHGEGATFAAKAAGESGVRLIMQWNASLAVAAGGDLRGLAYVTGSLDGTTGGRYTAVASRASSSPLPTLLANATGAAHLSATEVCNAKSAAGRDGMQISARYGLCEIDYTLFSLAWDCGNLNLDQPTANERFGMITAAALEHFVREQDRSASFERFDAEWGEARLVGTD